MLKSYHHAWLSRHKDRSEEWLQERLDDGFHVHHLDGDHGNDDPSNLVLMDGVDHMLVHGMRMDEYVHEAKKKRRIAATDRRLALGRDLYAARSRGMSWRKAMAKVQGVDDVHSCDAMMASRHAKEYAMDAGLPWPVPFS